ncbi:hypothetical protein F2Q69_00016024 [Brassica cretica]|uniref:Uncharacterized protein n=1 Tax=Brassica cretica TaxID=69181 RepID=A0A8S9R6L2_BRACR|nr:hypothetical protein F2Q69_00016024 [Brassica cretica]
MKMSAMYVVDSNSACPSTVDVTSYLTPISTMLPHLISRYCLVPNPGEMNFSPFPISQIEVSVLLEHPGFSGVAALILLDMVAADQPLNTLSLTEEEVRVAAENYAIASLMQSHFDPMFTSNNDPLPPVSQSDTVPDVSGVVNQILSDAGISKEIPQTSTFPGDVVGGQCQSSNLDRLNEQKLPHPSPAPATVAAGPSVSSKFVSLKEKETTSHGGETHGSNPVEEASELGVDKNDDVDGSSNPSPTKFKVMCQQQTMLQVMVADELVNGGTLVQSG